MYTLATLRDLRLHLHLKGSDSAADAQLLDALGKASRLLESLTGRRYCPLLETRQLRIDRRFPREWILPDDLLQLISASVDGLALDLDQLRRLPDDPDLPASLLILDQECAVALPADATISLRGLWAWHDRWSDAWRGSGDSIQGAGLTESATELMVEDAAGPDESGMRPRFQVGQLLRVKSEYLRLIDIDEARNQLTVMRGVQGTTAAAQTPGAAIDLFSPAAAISELCLRYAGLLLSAGEPLDAENQPLLRTLRRLSA